MTADTWPGYGADACRRIIDDMPHLPITVHLDHATISTRYAGPRSIRLTPRLTEVTARQWHTINNTPLPVGPLLRIPYPSLGGTRSTAFPAALRSAVETLAADLDSRRAAA